MWLDFMAKISVIGAGYVGLVTGVGLALKGNDVICVEKIQEKVDRIKKGQSTIHERNLDENLSKVLGNKFEITTDIEYAVKNSEVTIICVGTYSRDDGRIDLSQIEEVSKDLGKVLKSKSSYHTIVIKSTVVPTTTRKFVIPFLENHSGKKCGIDFGLCVNPEFLREGRAIEDFMNPDRIVIGEFDSKSRAILEDIYTGFDSKIIRTSLETAEMIKYANNTFLGLLISFSNELANICESVGIDVNSVLEGLHHDNRLSPKLDGKKIFPDILSYLSPGPGFGGSCLPKDISALIKFAEDIGNDPKITRAIIEINKSRPERMVAALENELQTFNNKIITVLGVAFKPDTDDIRDSPSIEIIKLLLAKGAKVKLYDPVAMNNAKRILGEKIIYTSSLHEALKDSEGCFLVTKWEEFEEITPEILQASMKNPIIIDCRRALDANKFEGKVKYIGTGLGKI